MRFSRHLLLFVMTAMALQRTVQGFAQRAMVQTKSRPPHMVGTQAVSFTTSISSESILDPLVVCGPSGVGKGTIIAKYMEEFGGNERFGFTVSHTTRAPRPGEIPGKHYHFVPYEEMKAQIERGLFLEHAEVHGNLYGTSWESVRDVADQTGKRCLLDIDVQGVQQLQRLATSATMRPKYLFIAPPSLQVLQDRLVGRGTETAESLARRTANARAELEYGLREGNFDGVVINDDLEEATRRFAQAVLLLYPDLSSL